MKKTTKTKWIIPGNKCNCKALLPNMLSFKKDIFISFLQMRTLRLRKVNCLAQGHTAGLRAGVDFPQNLPKGDKS